MRRSDGRDSRPRFLSKGLPWFEFSALYIHPGDRAGPSELPTDVSYVCRLRIRHPADDGIVLRQPRYGMKGIVFERPDSSSFRPVHRHVLPIRRDLYTGNAFGSHRLGVASTDVDNVIASTMADFNPTGQKPLAIRKKPAHFVAYGIVRELP